MKVKLIGALSYSAPSKGVMTPMRLHQENEVDAELGEYLLGLTFLDPLGRAQKMFTTDMDAEATYAPASKDMDLQVAMRQAKKDNMEARAKRTSATVESKRTRNKVAEATPKAEPEAEAPAPAKKTATRSRTK